MTKNISNIDDEESLITTLNTTKWVIVSCTYASALMSQAEGALRATEISVPLLRTHLNKTILPVTNMSRSVRAFTPVVMHYLHFEHTASRHILLWEVGSCRWHFSRTDEIQILLQNTSEQYSSWPHNVKTRGSHTRSENIQESQLPQNQ